MHLHLPYHFPSKIDLLSAILLSLFANLLPVFAIVEYYEKSNIV